jgi:hypothetical protein
MMGKDRVCLTGQDLLQRKVVKKVKKTKFWKNNSLFVMLLKWDMQITFFKKKEL